MSRNPAEAAQTRRERRYDQLAGTQLMTRRSVPTLARRVCDQLVLPIMSSFGADDGQGTK